MFLLRSSLFLTDAMEDLFLDKLPVWRRRNMNFREMRSIVILLVSGSCFIAVVLTFFWESIPPLPQSRPSSVYKVDKSVFLAPFLATTKISDISWLRSKHWPWSHRRDTCVDPYRRPGWLYTGQDGWYNETRWLPYTSDFFNLPVPPTAIYTPGLISNETDSDFSFDPHELPDDAILDSPLTPTEWMAVAVAEDHRRHLSRPKHAPGTTAADFISQRHGGSLAWLWGRVVLLIGDSVDRTMLEHFCSEFRASVFAPGDAHTYSSCAVPAFNLTLLQWHADGLLARRFEPYWDPLSTWVAFEDRWTHVWNGSLAQSVGGNGRGPDLLLWQSALWDQRNFAELAKVRYGESSEGAEMSRAMSWAELRHYGARAAAVLAFLREKFGSEMPFMLRAATIHRDTPGMDMMVYDADRLQRALAERFGMEVFEWGRIVAGHTGLYHDYHHLGKGAASWLWGTMVLEYLARVAGVGAMRRGVVGGIVPDERARYFQGWKACHDELIEWGGR